MEVEEMTLWAWMIVGLGVESVGMAGVVSCAVGLLGLSLLTGLPGLSLLAGLLSLVWTRDWGRVSFVVGLLGLVFLVGPEVIRGEFLGGGMAS